MILGKLKVIACLATLTLVPTAIGGVCDTPVQDERQLPAPFPSVAPKRVGLSAEKLNALVERMEKWLAEEEMVGAELLIIKDRKTVLHETVGWKDRERELPYERNTIARIRSMTKPFVGTSVLMLAEERKLRLREPIATYLPSWDNERSRDITIDQLLHHRGGFTQPGYPDPLVSYKSLREAVDATGIAGPQHEPDSRYFYSDAGSATLGAVVAEVSGMPVERFIETRILEPLGMGNSLTKLSEDDPRRPRVSSTYNRSGSDAPFVKYWENTQPQAMPFFRASGGMYSTPEDYAKFLALWMDHGRAGSKRLLKRTTTGRALEGVPTGSSYEYGMQWQIFTDAGVPPVGLPPFGHGGSDGTIAFADPKQDLMVLYFTQSRGGSTTRRMLKLARDATR